MDASHQHDRPPMTGVRARIADAAIRVIARDGFDVVSIRTVAKEAGIVHGTVQYWFPTRDSLLVGALWRFAQRQEQRVERVLAALPDPTPLADRLLAALRELLPIDPPRREEAAFWVAMSSAASTRPSLAAPYLAELAMLREAIRAGLELVVASGQASIRATPEQGAYLLSALINGLMIDGLNAPEEDLPRLEESLAIGVHIVLGVVFPA